MTLRLKVPPELVRRGRPGLGTLIELAVMPVSGIDTAAAIESAFRTVAELEACLSAHRSDSELRRVCAIAHLQPQLLSGPLRAVLTMALALHQESDGIFDVTQSPAAAAVSSRDIDLLEGGQVRFRQPLQINLGGIAKGYVIDRMVDRLQSFGIRSGCVNAGGDLRVFGEIVEPVSLRFADGFRTVAQLRDGAFAASRPGPRPMAVATAGASHFDGRTGAAIAVDETVAVFADSAMLADALTKVALVCPVTMDRLCRTHSAEWRRYPFHPTPSASALPACHAA